MNRKLKELFQVRDNVIYSVTGEATIKDAVDVMNIHHIGALLVMEENGAIKGLLSERDVMKKLAKTDDLVGHLKVKEIMTPYENLVIITGDEKIVEIMITMNEKHVRHLPIVDNDGVLHGLISMRDIFKLLLKDSQQEVQDMKGYVTGKYPA